MAAVQVEGHDGVRVMTVHAAKGLEFPVVAVADLGRGLGSGKPAAPSSSPDRAATPTRGAAAEAARGPRFGMRLPIAAGGVAALWELVELCEDERRADVEEACRLVYVAASRAQDRLILSGIFRSTDLEAPEEPRPSHSALKLLLPALARARLGRRRRVGRARPRAGDRGAARRRAASRGSRSAFRRRAPRARPSSAGASPRPAPPPTAPPSRRQPHLLEAARPAAAAGHLSYSALADLLRLRLPLLRRAGARPRGAPSASERRGDGRGRRGA